MSACANVTAPLEPPPDNPLPAETEVISAVLVLAILMVVPECVTSIPVPPFIVKVVPEPIP